MTASAQVEGQAVFLGAAAGSAGTFATTIYTATSGKAAYVEVEALAIDTTGNNASLIKQVAAVSGAASASVAGTTSVLVANDTSFGSSSFATAAGAGYAVTGTYTNQGTNAADVALFVSWAETQ